MEFNDLVRKRRSIRKFRKDTFSEEKLKNILEAARLAPSGGNRQPWRFIVVKENTIKTRLADATNKIWIVDAPIIIVGCWVSTPDITQVQCARDTAIAFEHIILAATNEGLATCWAGVTGYEEKIKNILKIPSEVGLLALVPIGYPAEEPRPLTRKNLEEIISYNEYKFNN